MAVPTLGDLKRLVPARHQIIDGTFIASGDPGPRDDFAIGAKPGCTWDNMATHTAYVCVSAEIGSAVWVQAEATGDGGVICRTWPFPESKGDGHSGS
jgi:hypothetical protein